MNFELLSWQTPILFFAGMFAGWIDSVAGGGGLVSVPVLLNLGLPPVVALGTNKFQSSFGSFSSSLRYVRAGMVDMRTALPGVLFTFVGAASGTWLVQKISPGLLGQIIPFLLLAMVLYFLFSPKIGENERPSRLPIFMLFLFFGLVLGFYDGFFGPGTGNFWALALVLVGGFSLRKATGYTKVMNFTSNIVSLALFLYGGHVLFTVGLVMAAGQFTGARIGAGMVISRGASFIRPVFITVVTVLTLSLFWKYYF